MPEKRHCTMQYMKAVLSGEKGVYKNDEVKPINVPRYKGLSLKSVFDHARKTPSMYKYVPEQLDDAEPQLDREFLFTVVNTCDRDYFPSQMRRIEDEKREAAEKIKQDVIEVRPELLALIESFGQDTHRVSKGSSARSLAMLKKGSKKRTRKQFEESKVTFSVPGASEI